MAENKDYITYSEEKGSVNISEEVVAIIAGGAVLEVDGVDGLYSSHGRDIAEIIGKKSLTKGVKIKVEEEGITADLYIMVEIGCAINNVGKAVQVAVKSAVEATTGIEVLAVNVHVSGISFKK